MEKFELFCQTLFPSYIDHQVDILCIYKIIKLIVCREFLKTSVSKKIIRLFISIIQL
jgi:hypothetical protein